MAISHRDSDNALSLHCTVEIAPFLCGLLYSISIEPFPAARVINGKDAGVNNSTENMLLSLL